MNSLFLNSLSTFKLIFVFLFLIPSMTSAQWIQMGSDIDGEDSLDESGWSISMNGLGDRMAIGAPYNDENGANSGHVRIYEWNGTTWAQLGADIDGEDSLDLFGWSVSIDSLGNRLAIGAPNNDGNGVNSGHVRIYEWSGTAWTQLGSDIDGEAANDGSGTSVSMNSAGGILAIGADGNSGNGSFSGHVRIYELDTTTTAWVQLGGDIDGEAAFDQSGSSISMNSSGNRLAIGAFLNGGNGMFSGHVRTYEWNGTSWVQMGTDIDGESGDNFCGRSVSMNSAGDILAIGADGNDGNGSSSGHVRIYEWDTTSTTWVQLGTDIDGESAFDQSGFSVSINGIGDQVAIGAPFNDGNGRDAGHVRIYEWNGTAWAQLGADIDGEAVGDWSGYSVSMDSIGNLLAIGARYNDGNGNNAGHTRAYQYNISTGLTEPETVNSFLIYPNPSSESITIESHNSIGEIAQITSITGALLIEFNISQKSEVVDLSGLENGLYLLRVGAQTQKIIVAK